MIKVCYFTSKSASDVRVFAKECTSLVKAGYEVYLVCPNARDEVRNGVHIIGVEYSKKGEYNRLFQLPKKLYQRALLVDADIYHFNDPMCLRFVSDLKRLGKKVIFDSFEDHPTLLFEKKQIPKLLLKAISGLYSCYEFQKCKKIDGLICCYHWTQDRLNKACLNSQLVFNFPLISEGVEAVERRRGDFSVCYAGLISHIWNVESVVSALEELNNVRFNFAGWGEESLINRMRRLSGWSQVNFLGKISRQEVVSKVYQQSNVGIALLDYLPLCKGKMGNLSNNKLFEYMLAGLPVICTDFILWKGIVEKNNCGICVNPKNVDEIARAIKYLSDNQEKANEMGANGRRIVLEEYNWGTQNEKLISLYNKIMCDD